MPEITFPRVLKLSHKPLQHLDYLILGLSPG